MTTDNDVRVSKEVMLVIFKAERVKGHRSLDVRHPPVAIEEMPVAVDAYCVPCVLVGGVAGRDVLAGLVAFIFGAAVDFNATKTEESTDKKTMIVYKMKHFLCEQCCILPDGNSLNQSLCTLA